MHLRFVVMRLRTSVANPSVIAHSSDLEERPWHAKAALSHTCHS
jgi:hypothetical protein